jgi:maltose alpha-D-glucosyltransferase/alpha-amylase
VFGLGSFEPLDHDVPAVFAHIRRLDDDIVVCAHNLSRSKQTVDVDLSEFNSLVPEDLVTGERLAAIGERPYALTLGPRGYRWLLLVDNGPTDGLPPAA